jgi:hypothetical protein
MMTLSAILIAALITATLALLIRQQAGAPRRAGGDAGAGGCDVIIDPACHGGGGGDGGGDSGCGGGCGGCGS